MVVLAADDSVSSARLQKVPVAIAVAATVAPTDPLPVQGHQRGCLRDALRITPGTRINPVNDPGTAADDGSLRHARGCREVSAVNNKDISVGERSLTKY